ncbi:MAG: adenylate/guanylate cyclase domain-containing protein [Beijerinckiaceae bacterium]
MDVVQEWRWAIWKSPPGTILLYGAVLVHVALTLKRIVARQTWRMPLDEALQIVLGLLIPVFVANHILSTRIAGSFHGVDETYRAVLYSLWPNHALWQMLLLVIVWAHGVIGIHHTFRHRRWYPRMRSAGLVTAFLIPTVALAGFITSGREVHLSGQKVEPPTEAQREGIDRAGVMLHGALGAVGVLALGLVAFGAARRRAARQIVINYRGRGPVRVPRGTSVLEASRIYGIPHPSVCGGRGRCSTCRIHVLSSLDKLPAPNATEQAMLTRIAAQAGVRLACQLRPSDNISLRILMPLLGQSRAVLSEIAGEGWAVERNVTVLFIDLRAFNALTRRQLPYEVAVLINRFLAEMTQAVNHYGGRVEVFFGDGLIAVFDKEDDTASGSRDAIRAAADMTRVLEILNREMGTALPIPVRAGIGIHTGPAIIANVGEEKRQAEPMALGPTVSIAARLQNATKDLLADYLISETSATASGFDFSMQDIREIVVEELDLTVRAYALADSGALFSISGVERDLEPVEASAAP